MKRNLTFVFVTFALKAAFQGNDGCCDFFPGNYSVTGFEMILTRRMSHYMITYYLPSSLFVVVSWTSFLIPSDDIQGRMALLVTLFLVLVRLKWLSRDLRSWPWYHLKLLLIYFTASIGHPKLFGINQLIKIWRDIFFASFINRLKSIKRGWPIRVKCHSMNVNWMHFPKRNIVKICYSLNLMYQLQILNWSRFQRWGWVRLE